MVDSGFPGGPATPIRPGSTALPGSWSILLDMARTQRRRGRDAAGEDAQPTVPETPATADNGGARRRPRPTARAVRRIRDFWLFLLVRAAHPRQALATAVGVGAVAALAGRPTREVGVVALTVLIGQVVLGWHNDIVDRDRDARHHVPGKPVADGRLDPGTVWFALTVAVLALVPLAISTGVIAGINYLISVMIGVLANVALRKGVFSWVPWALSFALYPAYISYGGWGGEAEGPPPEAVMTLLAGLFGVGVHFLRSIWGLVADNEDGWTYLPLRLGLKLGATRLLVLTSTYLVMVLVGLAVAGSMAGLSQ